MRTQDWTPLWRSTIGFDHLLNVFDEAQRAVEDSYPPYNIERLSDDRYKITVALAGFGQDDISLTAEQNVLTIEGRKTAKEKTAFLFQGISARPFKRQFRLAGYVEVKSAKLMNGLLTIELLRELPEAMKPKTIPINGQAKPAPRQIESKAA